MTYKFHSRAAADVLMLQADGERVLSAMGVLPATKGILLPEALPAAIESIRMAIDRDASARARPHPAQGQTGAMSDDDGEPEEVEVSLRQRAWPLLDMMRQALAAHEAVVWGV